jgi:hypothetical protein
MFAHAILTVIAAREWSHHLPDHKLIPLTVDEIRRPSAKLITNTPLFANPISRYSRISSMPLNRRWMHPSPV